MIPFLSLMIPILLFTACATQLDTKTKDSLETEPFRHITAFHIGVEKLNQHLQKDGLSREQILADVEKRLRQAGIRVLTIEEYRASEDRPTLTVTVSATRQQDGSYLFRTSVDFYRRLRSLRPQDSTVSLAGVLTYHGEVSTTKGSDMRDIRDDIKHLVDKFIEHFIDYKAMEWRNH
jgi:hypothetical protein